MANGDEERLPIPPLGTELPNLGKFDLSNPAEALAWNLMVGPLLADFAEAKGREATTYGELNEHVPEFLVRRDEELGPRQQALFDYWDELEKAGLIDLDKSSAAFLTYMENSFDPLWAEYENRTRGKEDAPTFTEWVQSEVVRQVEQAIEVPGVAPQRSLEEVLRDSYAQWYESITGQQLTPEQLEAVVANPSELLGLQAPGASVFDEAFARLAPELRGRTLGDDDVRNVRARLAEEWNLQAAIGGVTAEQAEEFIRSRFEETAQGVLEDLETVLTTRRGTVQEEAERAEELRLMGREREAGFIEQRIGGGPPVPTAEDIAGPIERRAQRLRTAEAADPGEEQFAGSQQLLASAEAIRAGPPGFGATGRVVTQAQQRRGQLEELLGQEQDRGFVDFLRRQFGESSTSRGFVAERGRFMDVITGQRERREPQTGFKQFLGQRIEELRREFGGVDRLEQTRLQNRQLGQARRGGAPSRTFTLRRG